MGAELSLYSSYSLGEPFQLESDIWEICPALGKEDDQEFTVFLHDKEKQNNKVDTAIKVWLTENFINFLLAFYINVKCKLVMLNDTYNLKTIKSMVKMCTNALT